MWDGKRPYLAHLIFFGCDSFVHVPKEKIRKIDNKSEKLIFIGHKDGVKGYRLWNPIMRKEASNIDVTFKEFRGTSRIE